MIRIFLVVGAVDFATKTSIDTPELLQHETSWKWHNYLLIVSLLVLLYRLSSIGLSITIAGAFCNFVDGLDGVAQNPFVIQIGNNLLGFNAADVAIITGIIVSASRLATMITRRSLSRS